ncbi:MAG: hypothetical protein J0M28_19010 [Thauera sp.]|nr:hypothetical protein [Thauera sp.]
MFERRRVAIKPSALLALSLAAVAVVLAAIFFAYRQPALLLNFGNLMSCG